MSSNSVIDAGSMAALLVIVVRCLIGLRCRWARICGTTTFVTLVFSRTAARQRLSTVRADEVEEFSIAAWAELEAALTDRLRTNIGLRSSWYDADVTALSLPANGGEASDDILTPTASVAYRATDSIELYASYGQGFHSNDVRGATITTDPVSNEAVDAVPILVKAEGGEIGLRYEQENINATVAFFTLDLESELVFVGDAGTTEANDGTTRQGVEATLFWQPTDWLTLDASAAFTDAEFDISGDATEIPGAVDTVLAGGAVARFDPLTFSVRVRHFGEAPLIEDGSVTSDPTTIVNLGTDYDWGRVSFGLDILNVFDADDPDVSYFFESQLPGKPNRSRTSTSTRPSRDRLGRAYGIGSRGLGFDWRRPSTASGGFANVDAINLCTECTVLTVC